LIVAEKVALALAVFGKPAIEQTGKRVSRVLDARLSGSRHIVERETPFAYMAPGVQAGLYQRLLALLLDYLLILVFVDTVPGISLATVEAVM
jgi:hypothetical protein